MDIHAGGITLAVFCPSFLSVPASVKMHRTAIFYFILSAAKMTYDRYQEEKEEKKKNKKKKKKKITTPIYGFKKISKTER